MPKLEHHGQYWPVLEAIELKPNEAAVEQYPGIKKQVVLYAFCLEEHCQSRKLYAWYPVYKDGTESQDLNKIKNREFEKEWFPRFQTDIIEPDRPTRKHNYVGVHTKEIHKPASSSINYLKRKHNYGSGLIPLPTGVTAAEIYGSLHSA